MMTAVIAMSVLLHLYIEKPCLAWLKARLLAKPAPAREVKPAYET
jgi:peptidoglycan/LPS O-acetylase OafA/YrhL